MGIGLGIMFLPTFAIGARFSLFESFSLYPDSIRDNKHRQKNVPEIGRRGEFLHTRKKQLLFKNGESPPTSPSYLLPGNVLSELVKTHRERRKTLL